MFIDGLWLSGITLDIDRSDLPIPSSMRGKPLRIRLTPTQVNAVATLLGFGIRNGDLLMYQDDDLHNLIMDPKDDTFRTEYASLSTGLKSKRRAMRVFTPMVETDEGELVKLIEEGSGGAFDYIRVPEEDNEAHYSADEDDDDEAFTEEELEDLNIKRALHGSEMPKYPGDEQFADDVL